MNENVASQTESERLSEKTENMITATNMTAFEMKTLWQAGYMLTGYKDGTYIWEHTGV